MLRGFRTLPYCWACHFSYEVSYRDIINIILQLQQVVLIDTQTKSHLNFLRSGNNIPNRNRIRLHTVHIKRHSLLNGIDNMHLPEQQRDKIGGILGVEVVRQHWLGLVEVEV